MPALTQARLSEAAEAWDRTKDTTNIAVLNALTTRFKDTFFAELARERFRDCSNCPEMVVVPAGHFTMGSPANEPQRFDSEAQVQVSIATPFAVGRYAVIDEWDACATSGWGCERPIKYGWGAYKPHDEGCGRAGVRSSTSVGTMQKHIRGAIAQDRPDLPVTLRGQTRIRDASGHDDAVLVGSSITPKQANYNGSAEPYEGGGVKGEYRQRTVPIDSFEPNPGSLQRLGDI